MSNVDAGKVFGGIDWDISSYARGMLQAETMAKVFPQIVTAFIADPLLGIADTAKLAFDGVAKAMEYGIKGIENYATAIREVAAADAQAAETAGALGLSVETFTALAGAAKFAGADSMALADGLKDLNRNTADAAEGNAALRLEFYQLGVAIEDNRGQLRSSQDVFFDVADAISRIPSAALQTRVAMDLFGRGTRDIIPFLQLGSAGIRQYMEVAERLGATTSKSAGEAGKKFAYLKAEWDLMWVGIKNRATEPAIELIAKNFGKIQTAIFGISDAAAKEITFGFDWLLDHKQDIKNDFHEIRDEAEKLWKSIKADAPAAKAEIIKLWDECVGIKNYIVQQWPEIRVEISKFAHDIGPVLLGAAILETTAHVAGLITKVLALKDAFGLTGVAGATFGGKMSNALGVGVAATGVGFAVGKALGEKGNELRYGAYGLGVGGAISAAGFPEVGIPAALILNGLGRLVGRQKDYNTPDVQRARLHNALEAGGFHTYTDSSGNPIKVNVTIDPTKTAHEIAKAITPAIQKAVNDAKSSSLSDTQKIAQRNGL